MADRIKNVGAYSSNNASEMPSSTTVGFRKCAVMVSVKVHEYTVLLLDAINSTFSCEMNVQLLIFLSLLFPFQKL